MNPADLLQALPGLLVAALLPGFGLAVFIAPRWRPWEWLAVAAGLSAGFLEILGLVFHHLHVPFEPATVYPVVVMMGGLAFLRWMLARRSSSKTARESGRWPTVAVMGAGLVAGVASAAALAYSLRDQVLPPDIDPPEHGTWVNVIVRTHDVLSSVPVPLEHTFYFRPRLAFEATAALVSMTGGPAPAFSMMPVVLVAVALLPLGLAMLALEVTRSYWVAGLTPLLSTGMAFPSFQIELGRLPAVMDATLVAAALVAMARLLDGRDPIAHALMLTAITASIWVTHGLEAITALFIGGPLLIELLISKRSLLTLLRAAAAGAAAGAGALLADVLERTPKAPVAQFTELAGPARPTGLLGPGGAAHIHPRIVFEFFAQTDLNSPIALALLGLGIVAVLARRQLLWALAAYLLVLLAVADTFYSNRFNWLLVWPWHEPDRLLGIAYWVVPLLMAFGLVWALGLAIQSARPSRTWAAVTLAGMVAIAAAALAWATIERVWMRAFREDVNPYPWLPMRQLSSLSHWVIPILITTIILGVTWITLRLLYVAEAGGRRPGLASRASAAVLSSIAIGLFSLGLGLRQDMNTYDGALPHRQLITAADVAVMESMSRTLPSGSRVLTVGLSDAGMWVAAVTNDNLLVPKGYIGGELSQPLISAMGRACLDPTTAAHILTSFDAIFVGSHRLGGGPAPWDAHCLAAVPGLHEIARASSTEGDAHAFAVTRTVGTG